MEVAEGFREEADIEVMEWLVVRVGEHLEEQGAKGVAAA